MHSASRLKNKNGFTIIELLIAMAMTAIVLAGIFSVFQKQQKANFEQQQAVEIQQTLRAGMAIITNDIRMAGYDPDDTGTAGIITANTDNFVFRCNFNGTLKQISYSRYDAHDDKDLDIGRKEVDVVDGVPENGNNVLVAENISNFAFKYYDASQTELLPHPVLNPSDIRSIEVTVTATADKPDLSAYKGSSRTLTSHIMCRNLGI